MGQVWD